MRRAIIIIALAGMLLGAAAGAEESPAERAPNTNQLDASRVVALEYLETEILLALGITPAGAADIEGYRAWVGVLGDRLDGARDLGNRQSPNLERLAELDPSLIVSSHWRHGNLAQRLESIAPTLLYADLPEPQISDQYERMRAIVRDLGERVGRSDRADQVLGSLDEQLTAQRRKLDAGTSTKTIVVAQHVQGSQRFRLFTDNSLAIQVAERLNLNNGFNHAPEPFGFATVSLEGMLELPAQSHLLVVASRDDSAYQQLRESPLWRNVPPVSDGAVTTLRRDTWLFGGPLSAARIADRITDALTR